VAAIVAGDSRIAGRVRADGIHVEGGKAALADMIERMQGRIMVGAGGAKSRDEALELGEERPDYVFFGRFGYDTRPEPHSRNLALGRWWAEVIELPCIVLAGSDLASVEAVAATGAEFVGLSSAVFATGVDPAEAVARANRLLDERAPRFEGVS
jgi:thiamine-phosphate pyrophosphorylase